MRDYVIGLHYVQKRKHYTLKQKPTALETEKIKD